MEAIFTLPKEDRIHEAMVFRHWALGYEGQRPQRGGISQVGGALKLPSL